MFEQIIENINDQVLLKEFQIDIMKKVNYNSAAFKHYIRNKFKSLIIFSEKNSIHISECFVKFSEINQFDVLICFKKLSKKQKEIIKEDFENRGLVINID